MNFLGMKTLTIFGPKGSSIEIYAEKHNIPFSVETVGQNQNENNQFVIDDHILVKYKQVPEITEITIPKEITEIGKSAFWVCKELKKVKLHSGIHVIGSCAFYGCIGLQEIELSEGITEIGSQVFDGCSNLKSISIPEGVKSIGHYAFHKCISLNDIAVPESVETIDSDAFAGCSSMQSIVLSESIKEIDESSFDFGKDSFIGVDGIKKIENVVELMLAGCKINNVLSSESDDWLKEHFDVAVAVYLTQAGKKVKERCENLLRSDMNKSISIIIEMINSGKLKGNICKKVATFIIPTYETLDTSLVNALKEALNEIGAKAALKMFPA